jgi:hypothetical protein
MDFADEAAMKDRTNSSNGTTTAAGAFVCIDGVLEYRVQHEW